MTVPATWLDHLKVLAAAERVSLDCLGPEGLQELLARGLIQEDEHPRHSSLERRYEALQETHRQIVEAKGCADRLQRRLAPRSRLGGLLSSTSSDPDPEDPDAQQLLGLLEALRIQVRGVASSQDVGAQLNRIQDYLQVEGRDCLDQLAATDRELDEVQKQPRLGTQVEGAGFFRLSAAGEAALPEAPILTLLEGALQTALGPGQRGESYPHFKEDPSSLLALLVDRMADGHGAATVLAEYEALLQAFERVPLFAETRPLRAKIGFLLRLLRSTRDDPKRAYLWCSRERLGTALQRMDTVLPPTVATSGWALPYMADLFVVDGCPTEEEGQLDRRFQLFEAVHRLQSELLQNVRIRDGQFFRLALVLTHAVRTRNFSPGILLDRFIRQALEAITEAARCAPYDLGDRGTTLIFGTHLAHAAGFARARIQGPIATFAAIQDCFQQEAGPTRLPGQVLLHVFATLHRLERLGTPMPVAEYETLFRRIRKRIRHHKAAARIFGSAQIKAGDEAALTSNLCALACFQDLEYPPTTPFQGDVGMAGLYEFHQPGHAPLLGSAFGTLMLA